MNQQMAAIDTPISGNKVFVLDIPVDALNLELASDSIIASARQDRRGYVCLYNVHSAVTSHADPDLAHALRSATLTLPDGAPIAWMMRRKGVKNAKRVAGPDLMDSVCAKAETAHIPVFFFGSTNDTLEKLDRKLVSSYPNLDIRGSLSPRFGAWNRAEIQNYVDQINTSGATLIFIGLGCPKQEVWMSQVTSKVNGLMLGVGAAFDFHSGQIKRAPKIFQSLGLEWLHRLYSEPRRLFTRYATTNTVFLLRAAAELYRFRKNIIKGR